VAMPLAELDEGVVRE